MRVTHFLCYIRVICGCRHSRGRIPEGRALIIWNADIVVLVVNNDGITRCVILDECVADAVNIITRETHPVDGAIAWSGHNERSGAESAERNGAEQSRRRRRRLWRCVVNDTYSPQNKIDCNLNLYSSYTAPVYVRNAT